MKNLIFEVTEGIGIVKINRPEALNALNKEAVDELDVLADMIKTDTDIKTLIIGSDNNFAAGADIKDMADCNGEEAGRFSFSGTFQKIESLDIPTIAVINGYALGGGLELALTCDFRIASLTAKMGFPEINLGIMPGAGGTVRLPKLIGMQAAKEMIFFGEMIDAARSFQIGLVNCVTEPEKAMDTAMEWAKKLCKKAPVALKTAKRTIVKAAETPESIYALKIEEENWAFLFGTEDQKEGMKAFIEKRKPIYKGK